MCVIAVCEKRNLTDSELSLCWEANQDGAGVAWMEGGSLHWKKGIMEEEELLKFYHTIRHNLPHIVHCRITSVGETCKELTHPFVISPQSPIQQAGESKEGSVLFHNGTYSGWADALMALQIHLGKIVTGINSDSRVIAMLVDRLGIGILKHVGGRVAIINGKGELYRHGTWTEKRGIWFSNMGWEWPIEDDIKGDGGLLNFKGTIYRRIPRQ